mmetsp:Transcript_57694/g.151454  ORF Transcript_57694/g.151454 Transcript_57694/m.151454 type:complete len:231 (-) Transcript_57694:305-997(-)
MPHVAICTDTQSKPVAMSVPICAFAACRDKYRGVSSTPPSDWRSPTGGADAASRALDQPTRRHPRPTSSYRYAASGPRQKVESRRSCSLRAKRQGEIRCGAAARSARHNLLEPILLGIDLYLSKLRVGGGEAALEQPGALLERERLELRRLGDRRQPLERVLLELELVGIVAEQVFERLDLHGVLLLKRRELVAPLLGGALAGGQQLVELHIHHVNLELERRDQRVEALS